jgi:ammonia channel protein AmtB
MFGLKLQEKNEEQGLDALDHGESGYPMDEGGGWGTA